MLITENRSTALRAFTVMGLVLLAASVAAESPLKPARHGSVYVVAHRGAHEGIPENTLAAYARAIELECDFVEIDVRTTKDGAYVSIHNSTVDAYCTDGTTGKVRDLTLAELKALDIGSRIDPKYADERIPTLDEILALCRGKIGIYLDLKDADVAPLVDAIRRYGMEREVIWYAGESALREVAHACPTCIPMPDPGPESRLSPMLERMKPAVVASVWRHFSKAFVETCHSAGAIVIVDESDPSCWADALAWGADGIQTDHPKALIAFLANR